MRIQARAFAQAGLLIVVALVAAGVLILPHSFPHLFKPKDHTDGLVQAQAALKAEEAKEAALQQQLQAAQLAQSTAKDSQVRYAQQMILGADSSLSRAPAAARTAEVQLASSFLGRANVALAAAIGALPADQQAAILKIVDGALSQVEGERDAALAALKAKDQELAAANQAKATAASQAAKLQEADTQLKGQVAKAQGLVESKTKEVLDWVKKKDASDRANSGLQGTLRFFKRLIIGGLTLWLVLGVFAPILLRGLPELGLLQKILHWVSAVAVAPGHALVGWLNLRQAGSTLPTVVPFTVSNPQPPKSP